MFSTIDTSRANASRALPRRPRATKTTVSAMESGEVVMKINRIVDESTLTQPVRASGQVRRSRDITTHWVGVTFLAAVGAADFGSLDDVQRRFVELSRVRVSHKPLGKHTAKPELARFMRRIMCLSLVMPVGDLLRPKAGSALAQFDDIVPQHGSSFALSAVVASVFPGRVSTHRSAAVEIHTAMSVLRDAPVRVVLAADTVGERDFLPVPASMHSKVI